MSKPSLLDSLKGGDRRSIGRADRVVVTVRRDPSLFPVLISGLRHEDQLVRMRAADAVEKLTVAHPQWLRPFTRRLMSLAARTEQQELRWHLAQMLPRLELSPKDRMMAAAILRRYLEDRSRIVKTFAMQGLFDLAMQDNRLLAPVRRVIVSLTKTGSPAMKSRGRKLLRQIDSPTPNTRSLSAFVAEGAISPE